jgi:hypothetical protein
MKTMHVKRTATIVLAGGALAAWFAGAATSNRALPDPIVPRPHAIDRRGADLASEIAKLHERLRPTTAPRPAARNVFRFQVAPPPVVPAIPVARPALVEVPAAVNIAEPPLRLAGVAEDAGPEGPVRVAIVSGNDQLFMAKVGELVTPRYRVTAISAEAVELLDLETNALRRLALK